MVGVAVGTAALVVVLSVFNGLEDFIRSLYQSFDPDLKIESVEGKSFILSADSMKTLHAWPGIELVTEVIEDNAYVRYMDNEAVVKIKGVSDNFISQGRLDQNIVAGKQILREKDIPYAIVGRGLQYRLGISISNDFYALQVYYPKNLKPGITDPGQLANRKIIMPSAIFAIERQYDDSYVFVPLDFAADLMEYGNKRTSIEIKPLAGQSHSKLKGDLQVWLGSSYKILNSDEQHSGLLKAIKTEKLFVYITFSFILAVASFNIFFSLTMLAIDKKRDISILLSMGAPRSMVRKIFLFEGSIISLGGAIIGLIGGLLFCFLQSYFGIISMGMESSILDAYPIKMVFTDFLFTALSIIVITLLASFHPARLAAKTEIRDYV